MSHTYTSLHYHLVFGTKYRQPFLSQDLETRVWEYLAGIARQHGLLPHRVGGVEDHIHPALSCPPTITVSEQNSSPALKGWATIGSRYATAGMR